MPSKGEKVRRGTRRPTFSWKEFAEPSQGALVSCLGKLGSVDKT